MKEITKTNLNFKPDEDTMYPVFSVYGRSGDGAMFGFDVDNGVFFMMWDGPFSTGDRFELTWGKLVYNKYNTKTHTIMESIVIGNREFEPLHTNEWNLNKIGFYKPWIFANFSKVPRFQIPYNGISFFSPMGKSIFFVSSLKSIGLSKGPYRVYDGVKNKWTGLLIYYLSDGGRGGGDLWYNSGPFEIHFGFNSSGKQPYAYNINLSSVKPVIIPENGNKFAYANYQMIQKDYYGFSSYNAVVEWTYNQFYQGVFPIGWTSSRGWGGFLPTSYVDGIRSYLDGTYDRNLVIL